MTFYTKFLYWQTFDESQQEVHLKGNWRENPDLLNALIMDIPLEEAVSGLKKAYSIYDSIYFVRKMRVFYVDTSASDMNEMDKIDMFKVRRNKMKEAKLACMGKTPSGQKILILTEEYESLLKNSMDAKIDWEDRDWSLRRKIQSFWIPKIIVVPLFWGGFLFKSPPIIYDAVFNKSRDFVIWSVSDGDRGWYYYLSKKNGKWKLIKVKNGWIS